MKNNLFKEIIINFFITFGVSITLFLVNRYFLFYLGIKNLGLMKLFTQLLSYLNLAELGLVSASTFALYKPLSEKNYKQISIIMNTISSLYNKIFLFVLIIGLLLNPCIPFFIKDDINYKTIYLYWSLYVIGTSLSYIYAKYNILFIADQRFIFVRLIQGGSKIFCQVLQIITIIMLHSFFIFICILILDNLIQYICYKKYFNIFYKFIYKINQKDNSINKNLKNLFWHQISGPIVYNSDFILISKFISLDIVGIYASYQMIIQMILTIVAIITNVLKPKIGKFIAENNKNEVFNYWKILNVLFVFIGIIFSFCSYKLINSFIILWLGDNLILPKSTLILILINLFIRIFRIITDIFKEGNGFFDDIYLPISEAVINLIISLILVQYIGLNGVIIGTIVSNILIICIAKPVLVFKRCFDRNIKDYIKIYGNYLILIIISLISCNFIFKIIPLKNINSWFEWIMQGIITGSVTFIIIFIIFLTNKDFRDNLEFLRRNKK